MAGEGLGDAAIAALVKRPGLPTEDTSGIVVDVRRACLRDRCELEEATASIFVDMTMFIVVEVGGGLIDQKSTTRSKRIKIKGRTYYLMMQ